MTPRRQSGGTIADDRVILILEDGGIELPARLMIKDKNVVIFGLHS
jgi:hypothetical protein